MEKRHFWQDGKFDTWKGSRVGLTETDFTFFFSAESPFSNWHPTKLRLDGHEFQNTEQAMMYAKAVLFDDQETSLKILQTPDPRRVKALGRKVRGFDDAVWKREREAIMFSINLAKFTQNPDLKQQLLGTGRTCMVEASPFDRIWGIGMSATNPDATDRSRWKGQNLLGRTLTRVREQIRS